MTACVRTIDKGMSSLHEQGTQRLKRATKLDRNGQYEEAVPEYIAALEYFLAELKYEKRFVDVHTHTNRGCVH